jgi:hypothetical protein
VVDWVSLNVLCFIASPNWANGNRWQLLGIQCRTVASLQTELCGRWVWCLRLFCAW